MSFFRNVRKVRPDRTFRVDKFVHGVRAGHWQAVVERCRAALAEKGEDAFKEAKTNLPCITPWGVFLSRKAADLAERSGVMVVDLDDGDNPDVRDWAALRDELAAEDWVYAAFISPRGRGLKVFVLAGAEASPGAVLREVQEILDGRGLKADPSGKDCCRACFVSYDPAAYLADEEKVLSTFEGVEPEPELLPAAVEAPQTRKKKAYRLEAGPDGDAVSEDDEEARFVRYLDALCRACPELPYTEWVEVISACVALWGDGRAAMELALRWPEKTPGEYAKKVRQAIPCSSPHAMVYACCTKNGVRFEGKKGRPGKGKKAAAGDEAGSGDDGGADDEEAAAFDAQELIEPFFYDGPGRYYWDSGVQYILKNTSGVELKLRKELARRRLPWRKKKKDVSGPVDDLIELVQDQKSLTYSGPLAGKRRGAYRYGGHMILATFGPDIIEPKAGDCSFIMRLVDDLLLDGTEVGERQKRFFMGWMKCAFEALSAGAVRPGQCLVLAGEKNCGKTMLKNIIIKLLGGRFGSPYHYMIGVTRFNADLAAAECLVVDDESGFTDARIRKVIAAKIKSMLFSRHVSVECKGRDPFPFEPFWRMIFCVNDDPESLLVLPIMSDDIEDKIALLRCSKWVCPVPNFTVQEKKAVDDLIAEQIPAFLHEVMQFEIPEDERENRCGVRFFHHPELMEDMGVLSPENDFMALLDDVLRKCCLSGEFGNVSDIVGDARTARDWEAFIKKYGSEDACRELQKICHWPKASGIALGRLAKAKEPRVEKGTKIHGIQKWRVLSLPEWEEKYGKKHG